MVNIESWLRKEAKELATKANEVAKEIHDAVNKGNFDKANELNIKRRELTAQENKLYEMIGRLGEIKE